MQATAETRAPAPEGRELLDVRALYVNYHTRRGSVQAVRDVNFILHERENLAVIGESGSGKTTLGASLVRLLPRSATFKAERMQYLGGNKPVALDSLSEKALRHVRWQEIAIVFQAALSAFNPVFRIWDQFYDAAEAHGQRDRQKVKDRTVELLNFVQLDAKRVLNAYPHELSGGMRQRILIAMALLLNPKILILDEPTTALDILTQRNVIDLLRKLKTDLGLSMIFISHDLSLAAELADKVATMYAGEFVELGSVQEIFYRPKHPYTLGLIHGVPRVKAELSDLSSIKGSPPDLVNLPPGCKFHQRCDFVTDRCRVDVPTREMVDDEPGHYVSCFRWREIASGTANHAAE